MRVEREEKGKGRERRKKGGGWKRREKGGREGRREGEGGKRRGRRGKRRGRGKKRGWGERREKERETHLEPMANAYKVYYYYCCRCSEV